MKDRLTGLFCRFTPRNDGRKGCDIAFMMSPRLGDSLLAMIIVNNLQAEDFAVTVFSDTLYALRRWFPKHNIQPYPESSQARAILTSFDLLLHIYPHDVRYEAKQWHPQVMILDDHPIYRRLINMVDLQLAVCKELFQLSHCESYNGLIPPAGLHHRQYRERIVIHPTAYLKSRCWFPARFICLAHVLQNQGYEVIFVVSDAERQQVTWIIDQQLTLFIPQTLDELACLLYESAWFIGNDSGVGHLASNLGIPTVTLMQRRKVLLRWRPTWAPGEAILPWMPLIIRTWKERYWKYFITVGQVMRAFERLRRRCSGVL